MVNQLGVSGEDIATAYLLEQGWQIVARNWRCREGEVDVVAVDPDGVLVFVEVKTRAGLGYGAPLEAITTAKVRRLRRLAAHWLHQNRSVRPDLVRLDAIGIVRRPEQEPTIQHVRGIE